MLPESTPPARDTDADTDAEPDAPAAAAIRTVRAWVEEVRAGTPTDRGAQRRGRAAGRHRSILDDREGREFLIALSDLVIGASVPVAAARQLERLSRDLPSALPGAARVAAQLAGGFAVLTPGLVMPLVRSRFRRAIEGLVLVADPERLDTELAALPGGADAATLAILGEPPHGIAGADRRLAELMDLLGRPGVTSVSLRLGDVMGPRSPWAHDETVERAADRLLPLYEFAASSATTKQLTLEMETFDRFDLTLDVFLELLSRPEFADYDGGITLPAYFADSLPALQRLTVWAAERRARGGAGITVRLVKGGNVAIEGLHAERSGLPPATLTSRQETRTQFLRMVDWALTPERTDAVRIGLGTHNVFDIAYAHELVTRRGIPSRLQVEMQRGVSPFSDVVRGRLGGLRTYTPVVLNDDPAAASGYIIERMQEAGGDGFQSVAAALVDDEELFRREARTLEAAVERMREPAPQSERTGAHTIDPASPVLIDQSVPRGREWARSVLQRAKNSSVGQATVVASVVRTVEEAETRVQAAVDAGEAWAVRTPQHRATAIQDLAGVLDALRSSLIEALVSETGATLDEADAEVARALSAASSIARALAEGEPVDNVEAAPVAVVLVAPARLGAVSDTVEAVASAIAAGSAALIQPAHQARRCAALIAEAAQEAGLPGGLVGVIVPEDAAIARAVVAHPDIERVTFTGGRETATLLRSWRPERPASGDVDGVASVIVGETADLDAAIGDIVHAALARGGQHPGGARLVILIGALRDSQEFRRRLADAVHSIHAAPATEASSRMAPLIAGMPERQRRLLTTLAEPETWLVEPEVLDDRMTLWQPGVRDRVDAEHAIQRTAAVPAIVLTGAPDIEAAVALQNSGGGTVAGIQTLDIDELAYWLDNADAGTLAVNRPTIRSGGELPGGGWRGAGGMRGSGERILALSDWVPVFGEPRQHVRLDGISDPVRAIIEAAQPVMQFLEFDLVRAGAESDERAWIAHYRDAREEDPVGERTVVRHLPVETSIRLSAGVSSAQLVRVLAAATRAGARVRVSSAEPLPDRLVRFFADPACPLRVAEVLIEDDARWHARLQRGEIETPRIRLIGGDAGILATVLASRPEVAIHAAPVTTSGRLELLPFLRAQVVRMREQRHGRADPMIAMIEF